MRRRRKGLAAAILVAGLSLPLPGCAGGLPGGGALPGALLSIGASVGSYFLIKALD